VINDVAVRLKGNSTLRSLRSDPMPPMGAPGGAAAEAGGAQPDRRKETAEGEQPAGAAAGPGAAQQAEEQGERGPRVVMTQLSENEPQTLPLLLSFDQYAEGRAYQGRTEISIRPGTPMLNEAVALEVTAQSGQASQQYAYTVYSVNDSPTTTRLVVEHPDQAYADSLFDGNGVLYKVKAGSVFRYQGDDQTTYSEQFKQINGQGSADLQPIISLLKWLDEADTTRFEAELGDWVDTESLARYLATQHLFANFDDMGGPGANLYLWYNLDTGKFTVVSWDLNLALTGESTAGPHEDIGMAMPGAPADSAGAEQAGPPSGAPHAIGNQLKDRFLDSAAFRADYETAYRDLYEQFYRGGKASDITRKVGATVPLSESLAQEALDTAITELEQLLRARSEALSSSEVLIAE
jgi:spore coat protein CotH